MRPVTDNASAAATGLQRRRSSFAYCALLIFTIIYYVRPEDYVPGLDFIPWAKVSGGIALLALFFGLDRSKSKLKIPIEVKFLILLFGHMMLTIPFSVWRGGSFNVVFQQFSKGVIVAVLISMIVTELRELRRLLWIQSAAVIVVTAISIALGHTESGRLSGLQNGSLANPNDLAINIAISFPLCVAFLMATRGLVKKSLWAAGLIIMSYGVLITYSRSGFVALVIACLVCLWEYAIRGGRIHLLGIAVLAVIIATAVMLSTPNYVRRIESIFAGNIEGSEDNGSIETRKELLQESITLALQHPIFGVGPGNFPVITNRWRVSHNTYTELAAEAGFPALVLFLLALGRAFKNIRLVRKMPTYKEEKELQHFSSALWVSLSAYMVGACFASTEYNLFPYFMIGYTSALYRIAYPFGRSRSATGANPNVGTTTAIDRGKELAWIS